MSHRPAGSATLEAGPAVLPARPPYQLLRTLSCGQAFGWRVDEAARRVVVEAGYAEYQHATGHHVGRSAHDGGGVLGPRWERYGRAPFAALEPGNVVTLELGIDDVDGRGYLGLEEMALVTRDGCRWLSTPQRELWVLGG